MRPVNEDRKALTGRRIEDYVNGSLINKDELFPDGAYVLNIGDPWQRLDKDGVVTLEYETGEEASFVSNKELFFEFLPTELDVIHMEAGFLEQSYPEMMQSIEWKCRALEQFQEQGLTVADYPKQAVVATSIAEDLASLIPQLYDRFPNAWYAAVAIARGFNDLYLNATVIEPTMQRESVARKGLTEDQERDIRRNLIAEHRGGKKYAKSELVKGAYPHTDFDDHIFDRIVASWSISAHMFAAMSASDFMNVWDETDRLLQKDGAAYIWPLSYYFHNPDELMDSVERYQASGGCIGFIEGWGNELGEQELLWSDEVDVSRLSRYWDNMITAVVLGRGYSQKTKQRV